MQRVRDVERFEADLDRPLPGEHVGSRVTETDLEEDGRAFMAFAGAFGVSPDSIARGRNGDPPEGDAVPSSASV